MIGSIIKSFRHIAELELQLILSPFQKSLRRAGIAAFFLITSFPFWFLGLTMLILSLFFYLAGNNQFVNPALWSGVTSMGIGILLMIGGLMTLNKVR